MNTCTFQIAAIPDISDGCYFPSRKVLKGRNEVGECLLHDLLLRGFCWGKLGGNEVDGAINRKRERIMVNNKDKYLN
jgi:hypothetical protein